MKNFALISILGLFAVSAFSSCKKDYKCTCNIKVPLAQLDTTFVTDIDDAKKKEAKDRCKGSEDVYKSFFGLLGTADCSISAAE